MYTSYFHLKEVPFSIAPDPAYLYMSPRHQEALGHLLYGTGQYGGFVQLTGEVGTGKTTIIRTLLTQKLGPVDAALIHNPRQSEQEFVQSICDELGVAYVRENLTLKSLIDALNAFLLQQHEKGRRTVLIIDEAQQLAPGVLEQVRLLTNLETAKEKLLRIMLVGQPELAELLGRNDLRQLAQRITARYHLTPLNPGETAEYIVHRLKVAGGAADLFTPAAIKAVYRNAGGVPRLINVICDRALLGAYAQSLRQVTAETVAAAAYEVLGPGPGRNALRAAPGATSAPAVSAERGPGLGAAIGTAFTSVIATGKRGAQAAGGALSRLPLRQLEVGLAVAALLIAAAFAWRYWDRSPQAPRASATTTAASTPAADATSAGAATSDGMDEVGADAGAPSADSSGAAAAATAARDDAAATGTNDSSDAASNATAATAPNAASAGAATSADASTPANAAPPAPRPPAPDSPAALARAAAAPLNQQMLKLARLWQPGFRASRNEAACRSLKRVRLECLRGSTEWGELAAINAPAILTLSFGRNDVRYVLLRELGGGRASLLASKGGRQVIDQSALDPFWTGEYLTLWARETDETVIGPDIRGEPIQWLRKRLAQRLGRAVGNPANGRWDSELKSAVQRFQTANGIRPDGIAGARTLLALAAPGPQLRKGSRR